MAFGRKDDDEEKVPGPWEVDSFPSRLMTDGMLQRTLNKREAQGYRLVQIVPVGDTIRAVYRKG